MLDPGQLADAFAGATHVVHCAGIAGVDTVLASPVRTMRVNVVGTYNVLEAALRSAGDARAARRLLDERGLRPARVQRARGARDDDRLRRRGALDLCRLEAGGRAHGARVPLRARSADVLRAAVQRVRPRSDRRRRHSRVHRGRARRARPHDPRRRLADPRLVLRRRHGRRCTARARARERGGRELQHRKRPLRGHDPRSRPAGEAPHGLSGRGRLPAAPLHGRRAADPEHREGARASRLRGEGRSRRGTRADDRVVPGEPGR